MIKCQVRIDKFRFWTKIGLKTVKEVLQNDYPEVELMVSLPFDFGDKLYSKDACEQNCTFKSEDKQKILACIKMFKEFMGS